MGIPRRAGRVVRAALATGVFVLAPMLSASAHGLRDQRLDPPVPLSLFVYGSAVVVIVSFVALGVLVKRPKLEADGPGVEPPGWLQRIGKSPVVEWFIRILSLIFFLVVFLAAAAGSPKAAENLAPVAIYIWFWVGLALLHALLGNWWATLSPWDTIARLLEIGDRPKRPYPVGWGKWPAALLLVAYLWLEIAYPYAERPRALAIAIAIYTIVTLAGMGVFGRRTWNENGEAFAVYFRLLSCMAPIARREDGRLILRLPLQGLTQVRPQPGLAIFVLTLIASTTFDGLTGTTWWFDWTLGLKVVPAALAATAGLLASIAIVAAVYALSMLSASAAAGIPWHQLAVRFIHSLIPIAFAYVGAHYLSYLLLEGQTGLSAISDPLGLGWNLFGTRTWTVNFGIISIIVLWYVQVGLMVLGHVAGVLLAHDRALAAFEPARAVKTQYALLAVMVLFTMGGLLVLSGG